MAKNPDGNSLGLFVTTKANHQPVGSAASVIKAKAMVTLTIQLQLSYRQLQGILFLLMLFYS